MENVHKTVTRPWISSEICVEEIKQQWNSTLANLKDNSLIHLKNKLGDEAFSNVDKQCGLDAMRSEYQDTIELGKNMLLPENINLETLQLQLKDLERRESDPQYESVLYNYSRLHNYPSEKVIGVEDLDLTGALVAKNDVLLTVQLYRPEKRMTSFIRHQLGRIPTFKLDQEFILLGSEPLVELRDKIECISDKAIPGDFSDMPDVVPEINCKDIYKSGFFYINGVFYNDMRHPDCRDYSEIIRKWARVPGRDIGPFSSASMETTNFVDLKMQLGCPYVYIHQGNCEHIMIFNDVVIHTNRYCQDRSKYPLSTMLKEKKRNFCMVCRKYMAEWIVYDCKRVPENPFFFCKSCFMSYNYDDKNQKIGDFRAYHHVDRSTIL